LKKKEIADAIGSGPPDDSVSGARPGPASPDLVDILCFRCVGRGRRGLVGQIEKYDHHLVIQTAIKVRRPLAMLIIKCHRCGEWVEYPLGLVGDVGLL